MSKTMCLVSIALCTYNGEKYLIEQLDSLVHQTHRNLEIIVVDDCSIDSTVNILEEYSHKYSFIKVYQNEINLGYIKNFEKALSLCAGDYIALCDQDDIWNLEKVTLQVNAIGDSLLIYHDSEFIGNDGLPMDKKMSDVINMYQGNSCKPFLFFNAVSGHACLLKKELLKYSLPFPNGVFHDRWLAYTATNVGSIKYLDQALVKYRQHENSDTNILKLTRKEIKNELHGVQKIKRSLAEIEVMKSFPLNREQLFVNKLHKLYTGRLDSYLCPSLVLFMFRHLKSLLYISNKNTASKLNFVFKHIWGTKLKSE